MDLLTSIDKVDASLGVGVDAAGAPEGVPSAADNDRALAELQGMMGALR